jgi:hypothetical protein
MYIKEMVEDVIYMYRTLWFAILHSVAAPQHSS